MNFIERFLFQPPGGQFREYIGISALFEPNDLALYQKLIATPLAMPKKPMGVIFAADYQKVASRLPMTSYQEWAVSLRCNWKGEEGWYCITMPVTKRMPRNGGVMIGFPKYVVDSIHLTQQNQGWLAQSIFNGKPQVSLEFTPGLSRQPAEWEKVFLDDETFFKHDPSFQLVPPSRGPKLNRVMLEFVVPSQWSPVNGMVQIKVDPSEPWAGLVKPGEAYAGSFNHFKGGSNIIWTVVS